MTQFALEVGESNTFELTHLASVAAVVSVPLICALLSNAISSGSICSDEERAARKSSRWQCAAWQSACVAGGVVSWARWLRPEVRNSAFALWHPAAFCRRAAALIWHSIAAFLAHLQAAAAAACHWVAARVLRRPPPLLTAAVASILLAFLLRRSSEGRLLMTALGALAAVEGGHMMYTQSDETPITQLGGWDVILVAGTLSLSVVASKVFGGSGRVEPVTHAPPSLQTPPRRSLSGSRPDLLSPHMRTLSNALSPRNALRAISMFGGGEEEAEGPADRGHFIVDPAGQAKPGRRPIAALVTRVSSMLCGTSQRRLTPLQSPVTPGRDQEWLSPQCRTIDDKFFSSPGDLGLKVRGVSYLSDKLKMEASGTEMELLVVDLVETAPTYHIAQHLPSVRQSSAPFMFIMQVMVPGKPTLSLTTVWGLPFDPMKASAPDTPFVRTLRAFITGDDTQRATIFKLIPRIEKGSWMIRQAVGQNTPVLLGRKLTTKYFCTDNYIEVDVDVGSSVTASRTVGLVQGAVKGLVIDMAVLLQGNSEECLPESLLGTMRLNHLDLSQAPALDCSTNTLTPKL